MIGFSLASDIRERVVLEMVGSPLTHQHWMRRYKGTYGAAIRAPDMFPGPSTGVKGLYRAGDVSSRLLIHFSNL